MAWHVRFFSPSLNQQLLSEDKSTEQEALETAWSLAQSGEEVVSVEGPDGEIASAEEIEAWFRERGAAPQL